VDRAAAMVESLLRPVNEAGHPSDLPAVHRAVRPVACCFTPYDAPHTPHDTPHTPHPKRHASHPTPRTARSTPTLNPMEPPLQCCVKAPAPVPHVHVVIQHTV
jgi:hypothetical protein